MKSKVKMHWSGLRWTTRLVSRRGEVAHLTPPVADLRRNSDTAACFAEPTVYNGWVDAPSGVRKCKRCLKQAGGAKEPKTPCIWCRKFFPSDKVIERKTLKNLWTYVCLKCSQHTTTEGLLRRMPSALSEYGTNAERTKWAKKGIY